MSAIVATGPSSETIGLVVGCAVATVTAILSALGWLTRRFISQQASNHQDTRKALSALEDIRAELPALGFRLTRLEAVAIAGAVWGAILTTRHRWSDKL